MLTLKICSHDCIHGYFSDKGEASSSKDTTPIVKTEEVENKLRVDVDECELDRVETPTPRLLPELNVSVE